MHKVKIIADSISEAGYRLTTFQLEYWRGIHGELLTHRMLSRSASSSRATPVEKMIKQVRERPAGPIHWGANQKGMQAFKEVTDPEEAKALWIEAANAAADQAEKLLALGLHKQVANRVLEPFQYMQTVVTATDWANFFSLRCHKDAQPEFRVLAEEMREQLHTNTPDKVGKYGWHLPYLREDDADLPINTKIACCIARCARVSYMNHDGSTTTVEQDMDLYKRLLGSEPRHASPAEHVARPQLGRNSNFNGWLQFRAYLE